MTFRQQLLHFQKRQLTNSKSERMVCIQSIEKASHQVSGMSRSATKLKKSDVVYEPKMLNIQAVCPDASHLASGTWYLTTDASHLAPGS